jgi:hypothetical protein
MADKTITVQASESVSMDGWPTKQEAAAALGVSTKTLEKYVQQGKLRQQMQAQINKPARAVIDPETLERMLSERSSVTVPERSENLPARGSQNLLEALLAALPERSQYIPLWLIEDEAMRYSGLGREGLRSKYAGQKIGPRGALVYRRKDLEER